MEKNIYFHPIIVTDQKNLIAFTCGILNNDSAKIETIDDMKNALKSFGDDFGELNCNGCYKGNMLLSYYYQKENGVDTFNFRYVDKETGLVKTVVDPVVEPDYMRDGADQIL